MLLIACYRSLSCVPPSQNAHVTIPHIAPDSPTDIAGLWRDTSSGDNCTTVKWWQFTAHTHTHTHTHNHFMAVSILSGTTRLSWYQKKTFTHSHSSWPSIIPYLLPPSITIHGILPVQFVCLTVFFYNLSKFSLIYILAWHPPLHTPNISSHNYCLLFAAHAHTIATCFAVVPWLCRLIIVCLSTVYLELYLVV